MFSSDNVKKDEPCPKCRENGRDKTGNHLMTFKDGNKFCNRCGYTVRKENGKPIAVDAEPEDIQRPSEFRDAYISSLPVASLISRNIDSNIADIYKVKTDDKYHYYPLTFDDVCIGYKRRTIAEKEFTILGSGKTNQFFGHHLLGNAGGKVFITEGELDAMSVCQALMRQQKPDALKTFGIPPVISLPHGSGSAKKLLIENKERLDGFKSIVLIPDTDKAGRKMVEDAAAVFGREKLLEINLSPYEDANHMVMKGMEQMLAVLCLSKGKTPQPEQVVWGEEVPLEELMKPIPKGVKIVQYPGMSRKMHGLRTGGDGAELIVVCSGSGMGKTTYTHEWAYCLRKFYDMTIGTIRLEESIKKSEQTLIAIDNNVPIAKLREDPSALSKQAWEKSYEEVIGRGRVAFLDHFGSLDSAHLVDQFKWLAGVGGCQVIFLDHISMVVSGTSSQYGERKDLDILMTNLASFVETSGTTVVAVVHLKRPEGDKSYNDGHKISLSALRGSAGLEQLSHTVISIEGDQRENDGNRRVSHLIKNREWGEVGVGDVMTYFPATGRLLGQEYKI
jgi:twinkle protein